MVKTKSGLEYELRVDRQTPAEGGNIFRMNLRAVYNSKWFYIKLLEVRESADGDRTFVVVPPHQTTQYNMLQRTIKDVFGASFPQPARCVVTDEKIARYEEMVADVLDNLHRFVK